MLRDCSPDLRQAIRQFIAEARVSDKNALVIKQSFPDNLTVRQKLYLLRGLLVHRILLLTLKKRWNVQYGLHPDRSPMAVPFHAKGVPSETAEWGHPDVAILFTCLSFYYGRLSISQLRQNLAFLLKSDDPPVEYNPWTQTSKSLPGPLRDWKAVNLDDDIQFKEIWNDLRYPVGVIDHFLSRFVFPRHAKQFQVNLSASGWDIPAFDSHEALQHGAQIQSSLLSSTCLATGFSGTNDNKSMLPLLIKQGDLPALAYTNAEVVTYLLQPRNRKYEVAADFHTGPHLTERGLLVTLKNKGIRILIDAAAQILEIDNLTLAKPWLERDTLATAAIYFDSENKSFILYRRGMKALLLATPFAENPEFCLVYLDEAHTRGTDLKLPIWAREALTLGLGQTKDRTVQAAMRLRQLATTQSVTFFAPPEVHQSIQDLHKKHRPEPMDSRHVIYWLLEQKCLGIEQLQPLDYSQGDDFCRRMHALIDNPNFWADRSQRNDCLTALKRLERQTLEQLYAPRLHGKRNNVTSISDSRLKIFTKELNVRRKAFRDTGDAVHGSALREVEQEREVASEVEAVREVQKPVHYSALSFGGLHGDIAHFASIGRLAADSGCSEPMMRTLRLTALGHKFGIDSDASCRLHVSVEFLRTVSVP